MEMNVGEEDQEEAAAQTGLHRWSLGQEIVGQQGWVSRAKFKVGCTQ